MPVVTIRSTREILEELSSTLDNPAAMVPLRVVYELAVHLAQVESKIGGTMASGQ